MIYKELPESHPLITANAVLAEVYMRLATAMQNDHVQPMRGRFLASLPAISAGKSWICLANRLRNRWIPDF
jgi:hypothetical protein